LVSWQAPDVGLAEPGFQKTLCLKSPNGLGLLKGKADVIEPIYKAVRLRNGLNLK
jgi:hypothetical protein